MKHKQTSRHTTFTKPTKKNKSKTTKLHRQAIATNFYHKQLKIHQKTRLPFPVSIQGPSGSDA